MNDAPRLVITGAAGFIGRSLIERLVGRWTIEAVDRREAPRGLPIHRGRIRWHRADISNRSEVGELVAHLAEGGPVAVCLHLAAYYDFTGERHPEYERTNVGGTRCLLEASRALALERFVFASSVAACEFPPPGSALDETSPPDGRHVYAESKRRGEALVRAEREVPTAIVRFAALFSDWCEYFPLYRFLETWLGCGWNRRVLGGRGRSAVPYLHVREACGALERLFALRAELAPAEVVAISPNDVASHEDLFRATQRAAGIGGLAPLHVPKPVAALGIRGRDLLGRAIGRRPFERPWMAGMIDRRLTVDARRSQARLGWEPRAELGILARLPFLLENRLSQPWLWKVHNEARLPGAEPPLEHRVLRSLERHEDEIFTRLTAALVAGRIHLPHDDGVALLRGLADAVHYRDRADFRNGCRQLARRQAQQGLSARGLEQALRSLEEVCLTVVLRDGRAAGPEAAIREILSEAVAFGLDGVAEGYEELGFEVPADGAPAPAAAR